MYKFRKTAACLLAALCMTSAVMLSGCNDEEESSGTTSDYVVSVPPEAEWPTDEGETFTAEMAQEITFQDKLTVKLDAVRELDSKKSTAGRVLFFELTITNLSEETLDLSFLTHFTLVADGETYEVGHSALANSQANAYYHDKGLELLHTPLAAKSAATEENPNTVTGVVAVLAPVSWENMKLVYTPYKYYSNDTVDIAVDEAKIAHITSTVTQ